MDILSLEDIKKRLDLNVASQALEEGFVAYSAGDVDVPPVGHLAFTAPPGDCHIKYGCIKGDRVYVIKIASGFYDNPACGLSPNNGMMLVFSADTGEPLALLQDEGWLTDIRTALAGQLCAKYFAPAKVGRIGIAGTGIQARLQLEFLQTVTDCRDVTVWGRSDERLASFKNDMAEKGFVVRVTRSAREMAEACNLIVTATAARAPLLDADWIKPGTHITAMGADAPGKQELDPEILGKADLVVVDSKSQCLDHGEAGHAVNAGAMAPERLRELGALLGADERYQRSADAITVCDLTGVAVQDIQIAKSVLGL